MFQAIMCSYYPYATLRNKIDLGINMVNLKICNVAAEPSVTPNFAVSHRLNKIMSL